MMCPSYPVYWPQFYTATILDWKHVLADNNYKDIIIDSLKFLVNNKRVELNAFVIMSNHIHLIWQALNEFTPSDIQLSFMKYTSQQIKRRLKTDASDLLAEFKVNKYDRDHQIWKRGALSIELVTPAVYFQKLEYIHENPVRAGICKYAEDYHYSSAKFYDDGVDNFEMLTHFTGN